MSEVVRNSFSISEISNGTGYRKRLPASWYNEAAAAAEEEEEGEIEE